MTKPSGKLKILYGEGDAEVVASQAVHIEKVGHEVTTAVGRKGVQEALGKEKFDLVVLGPTLSKNDRHHLPYMVKKANGMIRRGKPTNMTLGLLFLHPSSRAHAAILPAARRSITAIAACATSRVTVKPLSWA